MDVVEQLQTLRAQLAFAPNARRALEAFTSAERNSLLKSRKKPATVDDLIDAYSRKRGLTQDHALLELASRALLIDPGRYASLLEIIGRQHHDVSRDVPQFGPDGTLTFQGRDIGRFQLRSIKTKSQAVLEAFQSAGWPAKIPSPLEVADSKAVHDTVRVLNARVSAIRFGVLDSAKSILWRIDESA